MLLRIILTTAVLAAGMAFVKDGRVLEQAGLVGKCSTVATPAGDAGVWAACKPGKLEGRPDLTRRSCVSKGVSGTVEVWRCPVVVENGPAPIAAGAP